MVRAFDPLAIATTALCLGCSGSDPSQEAVGPDELVQLETPTGTLRGSLRIPDEPGPHSVVLIISGSGPTDRDGNSALIAGRNDSLKLLATGLAERGIASLRFDKRGVAGSRGAVRSEEELRFETYVDDAASWLEELRGDARFSSSSVLGHSEGSLVGLLAVKRLGNSRFISVAGPARRASEGMLEQLETQLSPELWDESARILRSLEAGMTVSDVPPALSFLFRPSAQPYLISWLRYVPSDEIATLEGPALLAQGTTDIQVSVADAEALHAAKPDSELLVLDGMNHVLKVVPPDPELQVASYSNPSLPVDENLVEAVARFAQ
jgi:pimeloyl-ACP methyl ester carboxylesterase